MNSESRIAGFSNRTKRSRIAVLFRFLLLFGLINGCSLPQAPGRLQWDVLLTVPFGSRTYQLNEMVDPDSTIRERGHGVGMNGDSLLYFATYETITGDFADSLRLDPFSYRISRPLTAIMLPLADDRDWYRSLSALNPQIAAYHGQTENLPQHPLAAGCDVPLPGVDSLRVDTGSVVFAVRNDLPYAVDALTLYLRDLRGQADWLYEFGTLAAGDSADARVSLAGALSGGALRFELSGTGRGGSGILVDSTRGFAVSAALGTLQCSPYYGVIGTQALTKDSSFALTTQRHRLAEGTVRQGTIDVTLYNETQLDDTVWITFPEVTSAAGDTLVVSSFVPAGQQRFVQADVAGYTVRLAAQRPQRLNGTLRSVSVPTADHRAFSGVGNERVEGEFSVSTVVFSYFDGEINNLTVDIPAEGQSVDRPPEGWESVHPTQVDGAITIHSDLALYADVNLEISSYYRGNLVDSVHAYFADLYLGVDCTLVIPNLAPLISTYPDSFGYTGYATTRGLVIATAMDEIRGDVSIVAPLRVTLGEVNAPGDVEIVEMDPLEDLQEGTARIKVWNRLPGGGETYIIAGHDSLALLPASGQDVDTIYIASIPTPPIAAGRATATAYAEYEVSLTAAIIELLEHPPFYFRANIHLPSSDGAERIAHGTDYITVQVTAQLVQTIDTEDEE